MLLVCALIGVVSLPRVVSGECQHRRAGLLLRSGDPELASRRWSKSLGCIGSLSLSFCARRVFLPQKSKLGTEQRDGIIRLYSEGVSIAQVTMRFGVSDGVMYRAFKRLNVPV